MKSKLRQITVDDHQYRWRVVPLSPHYVCLRLWANKHKSPPWAEVRYRFDDPWLHFPEILLGDPQQVNEILQLQPLRPAKVAHFIRQINQYMTSVEQPSGCYSFECTAEGELIAIADASKPPDQSPFSQ